jgi:hypothetical protein
MPRNFESDRAGDGGSREVRARLRRARCTVPDLTPVRAGGCGRRRMRRILHGRRRITAAGLAVAAAAMAASAPRADGGGETRAGPEPDTASASSAAAPKGRGHSSSRPRPSAAVAAPVRIADADTVRLLHPGDTVDVIAGSDASSPARVIAKGVRVDRVPESAEGGSADGALVVLRVPRRTETALAGAAVSTRLAVTLC